MPAKTCSTCNAEFTCNSEQGVQTCWCAKYPAIMPTDAGEDCRCQTCLARAIAERIETSLNRDSHEHMLEIASRFQKDGNMIEHIDYTIENGNYVFSAWYHLKRGTCCGNNCKNCPYPAQP